MTPAQLKDLVLRAPLGEFAAICAAVDERRGGKAADLKDVLGIVIRSLKPEDIVAAVNTGFGRGDASMMQKVIDMYKEVRGDVAGGDVTVHIEHYTVPDESIPHIIAHCADEQYRPIEAAVFARRTKVRNRTADRTALKEAKEKAVYEAMSPEQRAVRDSEKQKLAEMEKAKAMVEAEYKQKNDPTYLPDDMLGGNEFEDEE